MSSAEKTIFVAGIVQRTGSTLLERVLDAHKDLVIAPEAKFVSSLMKYPLRQSYSQCQWSEILSIVHNDDKLASWPGGVYEMIMGRLSKLSEPDFPKTYCTVLDCWQEYTGKTPLRRGNKKGMYAGKAAGKLVEVFPLADFIYIYRDPRDIAHSIKKNLTRNRHIYDIKGFAERLQRRHQRLSDFCERNKEHCFIVRYEDLVCDPENICRALCVFLGVDFDPGMLHFHHRAQQEELLIRSTTHIHGNTRRNFDPGLIGQWKNDEILSEHDISSITDHCKGLMHDLSYQ